MKKIILSISLILFLIPTIVFAQVSLKEFLRYNYQSGLGYFNTGVNAWLFGDTATSSDDLLEVDGDMTITGELTVDVVSSTNGLFTQGNGHFGGDLTVDGNATTTGSHTFGSSEYTKVELQPFAGIGNIPTWSSNALAGVFDASIVNFEGGIILSDVPGDPIAVEGLLGWTDGTNIYGTITGDAVNDRLNIGVFNGGVFFQNTDVGIASSTMPGRLNVDGDVYFESPVGVYNAQDIWADDSSANYFIGKESGSWRDLRYDNSSSRFEFDDSLYLIDRVQIDGTTNGVISGKAPQFTIGGTDDSITQIISNGAWRVRYSTDNSVSWANGASMDVTGGLDLTNNLTVAGSASTTAGLFTQGDSHVGGNLTVDGNSTTTGVAHGGYGSRIGGDSTVGLSTGNFNYWSVVEYNHLGLISFPMLKAQNLSLPAIVAGSSPYVGGVYQGLYVIESDASGSDANGNYGDPLMLFTSTDGATSLIKYATTTDQLQFLDATTYYFDTILGVATSTPWDGYELAVAGDGIIDGDFHVTGTSTIDYLWHAAGGFSFATTTITVNNAWDWATTTNGTGDLWQGDEADGFMFDNDVMTFEHPGDYEAIIDITFQGGLQKDFAFRVYDITNEMQVGRIGMMTGNGTNNFVHITKYVYFEDVEAGDKFRFEMTCASDGSDPTVYHSDFGIKYLHD